MIADVVAGAAIGRAVIERCAESRELGVLIAADEGDNDAFHPVDGVGEYVVIGGVHRRIEPKGSKAGDDGCDRSRGGGHVSPASLGGRVLGWGPRGRSATALV